MTNLQDIAILSFLLLVLAVVPVLGLRHEARISREIREAEAARERAATNPAAAGAVRETFLPAA